MSIICEFSIGERRGNSAVARLLFALSLLFVLGISSALGQITRVAQSSAATGGSGGTSVVVTKPAGTALNDVLVSVVTVRGSSQTINVPTGWNVVTGLSSTAGGNLNQRVFYLVAGASEPASYTFSWTVIERGSASILAYRNVDTTTPIDSTVGAQISAASTSIVAPSISTTLVNEMLIGFFGDAHSGATFTTPTGMTNIFGAGTEPGSGSGPNGVRTLIAEQLLTATGASGSRTATSSQNVANIGHMLALLPRAVVVTAPSGFNAFETTTTASAITGVITTKTSGSAFSLDVVAISAGAKMVTFNNNVKVELLGNAALGVSLDAQNCPTTFTVLQTIASTAIAAGRSTVSFAAVSDAWRDVRVRISYPTTSPTVTACSSDNFAIRPNVLSSLTVSDDGTWLNAGTTRNMNDMTFGTTLHKAGRPFSVRASAFNAAGTPAITANYTGSPTATLTACAGAACTATFGTLSLATAFTSGQLVSDIATYDNVGAFQLQLIDSSFTSVDAADTAGDCTSTGRYVCSSTLVVGRFVPDHFSVSYNTPIFATACGAGGFTYAGQTFSYSAGSAPVMTLRAENVANNATTLYTGNWLRVTSSSLTGKAYTVASGTLDTTGISGTDPVISDSGAGTATLTFSSGAGISFQRTTPVAPFDAEISLAINVIDADGVTYASNPARFGAASAGNGMAFSSGKPMRYGRLRLQNAFGPQGNDLPVTLLAEYWNGSAFATNTLDSCTTLAAGNFALSGYTGGISAANIKPGAPAAGNVSVGGAFSNGVGVLRLTKPSPTALTPGGVVICADLDGAAPTDATCVATTPANLPWLKGNWGNSITYIDDPKARVTFGLFGAQPKQFIFLREYY